MSEFVSYEVADGIATLRIDKPKLNPLDTSIQAAIGDAAREFSARDDIGAVIVWGGERAFAAGADIKDMSGRGYSEMVSRSVVLQRALSDLAAVPVPTIAAITGYALGGGCELAMACDFRIAASDAKLGQPEILLGLIPGGGGTQRLTRLVGPAKAKDLVFSGRMIDADEALAIGLVDELVEPGEVFEAARRRAAGYVAGPRLAIRAAKEAIDRGLDVDLRTGLDIETALFAGIFASEDAQTGMASFIENGPGKATFTGR